MKSIFTEEAFSEIKTRLNNLNEDAPRQWGKMTSGQMVHHCQLPLNVILEKEKFDMKPNWIVNLLFKKSMYSDKPWRKNMPTAPGFKETEPRDFTSEKAKLDELIEELGTQREKENWKPHPAFGKFTKEQWGKMQYKHLDHHFRQFGV
ncbi:hypothetical protein ULMS_11200 [Patiriisocius marinistellae]|uniref:DUF1569 domain-containing protein n=1 Tax=Patiriisocius marinistellae TaxID=2494560 RepID=A0A5J4FWQ3_9FLAO|nr:DUF1569 domain-containing protein [Patiriisocius marinistellae]GEQ85612.1 hypothetical protein ULMS_11200 [Patiriisocius marinistellae]